MDAPVLLRERLIEEYGTCPFPFWEKCMVLTLSHSVFHEPSQIEEHGAQTAQLTFPNSSHTFVLLQAGIEVLGSPTGTLPLWPMGFQLQINFEPWFLLVTFSKDPNKIPYFPGKNQSTSWATYSNSAKPNYGVRSPKIISRGRIKYLVLWCAFHKWKLPILRQDSIGLCY